ncbi:MAG TPA: fasciclin domain-containing protein [Nostocaceae cyanobacterium]|nr:fasciclin domain-containing protein [Nostocaceae cyanobacterium]
MKAHYSKLLTKFLGIVGLTGVSLLISLPSGAETAPNSQLSQNQQVFSNFSNSSLGKIAQNPSNGVLNPRPSIFNEPPYNQRNQPANTSTPPSTVIPNPPQTTTPPTRTDKNKNVVALIESDPSLKTLTAALKAAGLTETLQQQGPFTIFAPTDQAFADLPQDALQDLLKPENKEVLVKVLTYHVVSGKVLSRDLKSGQITSLQGDPINVKVSEEGVKVNDGQVIQADIEGRNGVIHKINTLILPPSL